VDIHPAASAFDARAHDYEKGRPGYPQGAVRWLVEALGVHRGSTLVDVAAGTGKLTRELVPTGARILAVEPLAGMREVLGSAVPEAEVIEGTAEQLPLPDGSVDAVTVAQAFHWFKAEEALAEIHRVLVPRGRLGLIWNRRDLARPFEAELQEIMERYRAGTPSYKGAPWQAAIGATHLFGPMAEAHFTMEQELDHDHAVARVLSISFIAQLPGTEQARVTHEVEKLAGRYGDPVVMHYLTDAYWCEKVK
jgi:SAM-dependent methyltransferase